MTKEEILDDVAKGFMTNWSQKAFKSTHRSLHQLIMQAMNIYAKQEVESSPVDVSDEEKKYEIDFGGNVLAGITIKDNKPTVFAAMNGYGDGISLDRITVIKK